MMPKIPIFFAIGTESALSRPVSSPRVLVCYNDGVGLGFRSAVGALRSRQEGLIPGEADGDRMQSQGGGSMGESPSRGLNLSRLKINSQPFPDDSMDSVDRKGIVKLEASRPTCRDLRLSDGNDLPARWTSTQSLVAGPKR